MIKFQPEPVNKHDVIFTDLENNEYLVHSVMLQFKSPVFRIIDFNINEKIPLPFSSKIVLPFFETAYSLDRCQVEREDFCDLWKLLEQYQIPTGGIRKDIRILLKGKASVTIEFILAANFLATKFNDHVMVNLTICGLLNKYPDEIPKEISMQLSSTSLIDIIGKLNNKKRKL